MRRAITVGIIVHCLVTVIVSMPSPPEAVRRAKAVAGIWARPLYSWQNWALFSPDAPRSVSRLEADVELPDGSLLMHQFALDEPMGYLRRYAFEHWRKLLIDNGYRFKTLHPYIARYIARQYAELKPTRVRLLRRTAEIPPPVPPLIPTRPPPYAAATEVLLVEDLRR